MLNKLSEPVTPATNPELWYKYYEIVQQDAPEILDTFIENTAAKMELTVDYFVQEFLWKKEKSYWLPDIRSKTSPNSSGIILMRSIWTTISFLFIMNSKDKFLYVIDYWIPFPSSEYGGLINVIASNDIEAYNILNEESSFRHSSSYDDLLMKNVLGATKLRLADDYESGIIEAFIT